MCPAPPPEGGEVGNFAARGVVTVAKPRVLLVDDTRLVLELEKSFLKLSHV